jgi:hypothetical protein
MKIRTGITTAWLLVMSGVLANAQQRVTVIGCPTPGVETNCLVIRGADNKTYNISGARQRPEIGQRAIRLTGTPTRKLSYCQQGIVLDNIAWSYTDQNCK